MKTGIILFAMLCVPVFAFSATIYVPDDYPTIQGAIDASADGDIIIVRAGTYKENIDFTGKAVIVISDQGAADTVIDGNQAGSVVTFQNREGLDSVLAGFKVMNGFAEHGGGIHCDASSPTITNNTITGNTAESLAGLGGGIYCTMSSSPEITHNTIIGNQASSTQSEPTRGGGIYCRESSPTIMNNTIKGNDALRGGGIYCRDHSSPLIANNTISGNTGSGYAGYGGGITCDYSSSPTITNNLISGNSSDHSGGGILCYSYSSPTITHNTIAENSAPSGGGIYCQGHCVPIIKSNTITANKSAGGGGIYCWNSSPTIMDNTINGNVTQKGGGIFCGVASPTIANNIISGNTAGSDGTTGYGGGIFFTKCVSPTITNNTITWNEAADGGGILCKFSSSLIVTNTILWDNSALIGPEISLGETATVDIAYSDVTGGQVSINVEPGGTLTWGSGMIDADPLFVDPGNGDFHLIHSSSCRASGDNATPHLPDYDFEGDPRICQGVVDMGADECYRHLYCMGDFTPGGNMKGKFVGLPGTSPVGLFLGSGVLDPPLPTAWGNFYLQAPWFLIPLVPIPGDGVLVLPATIPGSPSAPYDVPMQALIGLDSDSLSNLYVLEVR
ncbi:MAG: right-handed parallel beta-helix repeat-containing protein [Planctomycetota bacterium]|jgi:parallel beta-helix repeat protein/predicted outer membrane repeat protein